MPAQCWGAVLGAKVVQYRTALVLGVIGQAIGMTAFGPENYTVFSGLLNDWMSLQPYPRLTLYTLMWITVTPIAWHFLSIWRKILLPGYLATSMLLSSCSNLCITKGFSLCLCSFAQQNITLSKSELAILRARPLFLCSHCSCHYGPASCAACLQ